MKKRFDRSGTARRKAVTAIAALTMALVLAVGGAGAATLLSAQPETLTVGAVVPHITAEAPQQTAPADPAPAAESTATAPEQTAESTAQQAESVPEQAEKPETAEIVPAAPEEAVETPETPAQSAEDTALEEENSPAMLLEETPELAAQDPQAPAADGTAQNDTASQHTPEGSVLLTPEQIQQALDSGALEDAEAQCIDLTDENGFFQWLFNWLFGIKDKEEEPVYSGWRTENGKTYYYAQDTNKKVTGLRSIDGKLYYFDANGVKQDNVTFGIDVSKYQSGLDWNKIKKSGVSFVIIRIGYRGYGAAGNLVKDPMFEEHFTNARNAGLKVGVYFFTQAVNEAEAQEEADGCNWALNGRMLDYPIFYDTEASTAPHGTGRLCLSDYGHCQAGRRGPHQMRHRLLRAGEGTGLQTRRVRLHHMVPQAGGLQHPAQPLHHLERPLRRLLQPHRLRSVAGHRESPHQWLQRRAGRQYQLYRITLQKAAAHALCSGLFLAVGRF